MFLLLHGNRTPSATGSVSPQLIARTGRAIDRFFDRTDEPIERICFFAADRYPDGSKAFEHVRERLRATGIPESMIHIDPVATTTREEVKAFRAFLLSDKRVGHVTSLYHVARARYLLRRRGFDPVSYVTPVFGALDLSLEPMKIGLAFAYH